MHRYLLFAGDEFHPHGGWDDFICDRHTAEELKALCTWTKSPFGWILHVKHKNWKTDSFSGHWLHIVDRDTLEVVFQETSFKKAMHERDAKKDGGRSDTDRPPDIGGQIQ
jgi:hypothetical protein